MTDTLNGSQDHSYVDAQKTLLNGRQSQQQMRTGGGGGGGGGSGIGTYNTETPPHQQQPPLDPVPRYRNISRGNTAHLSANIEDTVLDRVPASIPNAESHAQATRMARPLENSKDICECCGYSIQNETLSLLCSTLDLSFLGAGIPLYFGFTKACMVMFTVSALIYTIYGMISNAAGTFCVDAVDNVTLSDSACISNLFNDFSLINKANDSDSLDQQDIVNLIVVIINVVLIHLYRRQTRIQEDLLDYHLISPSDFTVQLQNLPPNYTKFQVKQLLVDWHAQLPVEIRQKIGYFSIEKICIAYDVTEYLGKIQERNTINMKLRKNNVYALQNTGKYPPNEDKYALLKQKMEVQMEVDRLEDQVFNGKYDKTTPHCFVTFNTRKAMECLLDSQRLSYFEKLLLLPRKCIGSKLSELLQMQHEGETYVITVCRAPEPSDINWENCSATRSQKLTKRLMTWFVTLLLLGLCFFLIYIVSQWKHDVKESNKYKQNDSLVKAQLYLQSLFQSALVTFINMCLKMTIKFLSNQEQQSTVTALNITIAEKLTIAQFSNSALITLIVHLSINSSSFWGSGGITSDFALIAAMNCIVPPLLNFLNPWMLIRLIRRCRIRKNNHLGMYSQGEANRQFEGPQVELSVMYAATIKTLLMIGFYAPLSPYVLVIGLVGLLISYSVDKYLMLRRYARPNLIGSDLNNDMIELAEYFPFSMAIGNLIWMRKIGHDGLVLELIAVGISAINFIIPSAKLNQMIFKIDDLDDSAKIGTYAQNRLAFHNDYDRCNPITQEDAIKSYYNEVQKADQLKSKKAPTTAATTTVNAHRVTINQTRQTSQITPENQDIQYENLDNRPLVATTVGIQPIQSPVQRQPISSPVSGQRAASPKQRQSPVEQEQQRQNKQQGVSPNQPIRINKQQSPAKLSPDRQFVQLSEYQQQQQPQRYQFKSQEKQHQPYQTRVQATPQRIQPADQPLRPSPSSQAFAWNLPQHQQQQQQHYKQYPNTESEEQSGGYYNQKKSARATYN